MGFHTKMHYSRWTSSSSKSRLQKQPSTPPIYRLSDDVLLYLLLCPELDFIALYTLARTSRRFRSLVCQALQCYLLPDVQLTTMIDQEGRGKWTCRYSFDSFDETTLRATFTPSENKNYFKRYRCDGSTDVPTLRHLEILHDTGFTSSFLKDTRRYREKIAIEPQRIVRQTRRVGIHRCGIRSIQSRQLQERLAAKIYNMSYTPSSWQLSYLVSTQLPSTIPDSTSSVSSVSLVTDDGNNKQNAHSRYFNADNNQGAVRYVIPLRLSVDVSMLGQRTSNTGYKRVFNSLPLCWIRRKFSMDKQTGTVSS
ncbi:hypothetical protein BJV82DRAFT_589195 [Fennellomyces sp. T-0311]|nr:hypothetical protein BJV82DRAFT_589195 [Fennellomyces sp. T-0311]